MAANEQKKFSVNGIYELDENRDKGYEAVWTVEEYYNGLIWGVADYQGTPHIYRAVGEHIDDDGWCYIYGLAPILEVPCAPLSDEQLALAESSPIEAKGYLRHTCKYKSGYAILWDTI